MGKFHPLPHVKEGQNGSELHKFPILPPTHPPPLKLQSSALAESDCLGVLEPKSIDKASLAERTPGSGVLASVWHQAGVRLLSVHTSPGSPSRRCCSWRWRWRPPGDHPVHLPACRGIARKPVMTDGWAAQDCAGHFFSAFTMTQKKVYGQ